MSEKWRDASACSCYKVSNLGRVRGIQGALLKAQDHGAGYLGVSIHGKPVKVHRLVGEAFLGPMPKGYETDHLNGDKRDNRVINLAYVPHSINMKLHYAGPQGEATRAKHRAYALSPEGNAVKRRAGALGGGSNRNPVTVDAVMDLWERGDTLTQMSEALGVGVKVVRNRIAEGTI